MSFIDKSNIFLENECSTKEELFEFLSGKAKELNISDDIKDVIEGLYDREKEGNTVIADMIAMPHARIESVKNLKVILISLKNPISYNPDDNIDLVYSILSPLNANDEFIDTLTSIAIVAQDEDFQNIIRNSKLGNEEKIYLEIDNILKMYNQI